MGQGQKALNALKNGLSKLQRSVKKRRKALLDRLAKKECQLLTKRGLTMPEI